MILDTNFEQRKDDVDAHFRCLAFINSVEGHKRLPITDPTSGQQLIVDQQMQCCMKAQTLVLLYNMVESTVCECLNYIYDAVKDDGLTYAELTDEMRKMWNNSNKRADKHDHELPEADKMLLKAVYETIAVNTSGSIDIKKIYETFKKHGCTIPEEKRVGCGQSFLIVKNKRNLLAHGNVLFSQCGASYLYSDLDKMRKDIFLFLPVVIESTKQFVEDKKYKR